MLHYVSKGIRQGGKRTNVNSKLVKFIYIVINDGQLILNTHPSIMKLIA